MSREPGAAGTAQSVAATAVHQHNGGETGGAAPRPTPTSSRHMRKMLAALTTGDVVTVGWASFYPPIDRTDSADRLSCASVTVNAGDRLDDAHEAPSALPSYATYARGAAVSAILAGATDIPAPLDSGNSVTAPPGTATPEPQPHPGFTDDHYRRMIAIFEERGLFGPRKTRPNPDSEYAARIQIHPDSTATRYPHRRLSPDKREALELLIEEMLEDGRIVPSASPYSAPIVMVRKANGKWRFCVDYRGVNQNTIADAFPLPHINDVLAKVQGATVVSCIDLADGYHNLAMHPGDRHKTAFVSPTGLYEWTVLPFGLTNAPAQFSRFMANVTKGLPHVVFYIDDLAVASTSIEEHMSDLVALADRLAEHGLIINRSKLQLGLDGAHILGHTLVKGRLYISPDKQARLATWADPSNLKELQRLVGFCNYLRNWVPHFAEIAQPLTSACSGKAAFAWTPAMADAKRKLFQVLSAPQALRVPSPVGPFTLATDASNVATGGALFQNGEPVWYFSRLLDKHEQRYSVRDRELLAIIHTLRATRHLVGHQPVTAVTDHASLDTFLTTGDLHDNQDGLCRWWSELSRYSLTILYIKGKENWVADFLSRPFQTVSAVTTRRQTTQETTTGPTTSASENATTANKRGTEIPATYGDWAGTADDTPDDGIATSNVPASDGQDGTAAGGAAPTGTAAGDVDWHGCPRHELERIGIGPEQVPAYLTADALADIRRAYAKDKFFANIVAGLNSTTPPDKGDRRILLTSYTLRDGLL